MKDKKVVVWDLFGGGRNSVYKSLVEHNKIDIFDVYTFDVTEPEREKHFKLDLAQDINILKEYFKNLPQPDIIVASPLCQSFSCVLNMKGGGTPFWKYADETRTKLIERSSEEFEILKNGFTKNLKVDVQLFIKRLGEKCINNTIELIKEFNPRLWYIENPKNSLMWKYIKYNKTDFYKDTMHLNEASFGKYGFLTSKPTIFLSNIKIDLKKGKIDPPYEIKEIDGQKYYVLKDDNNVKVPYSLDSRMIGISSLKKMIKARTVKSGMGGMDFVMRSGKNAQKNKMTNEQLSEAGYKVQYHIR
ncbi:C5 methylase (MAV1virus-like) protein [Mycoplasmopsis cynos]|uniref:C5 methylase (MAV1virus-like) protein n=1 Tax=Mycoplasmopsis cynos TaxID=171284 RepID=UPI0022081041|nr:C5 methylase (MAV1virus-like) protein [Mycoplasmopsis cynos]UWV82356.1 C5 methylase (MAV1virus-like) protein [Mycoplasmopsis cynos]